MGWEGTRMLTSGEHDELWRNVFESHVPGIAVSLRRANAIECCKELQRLGMITERDYAKVLSQILVWEGYTSPLKDD